MTTANVTLHSFTCPPILVSDVVFIGTPETRATVSSCCCTTRATLTVPISLFQASLWWSNELPQWPLIYVFFFMIFMRYNTFSYYLNIILIFLVNNLSLYLLLLLFSLSNVSKWRRNSSNQSFCFSLFCTAESFKFQSFSGIVMWNKEKAS